MSSRTTASSLFLAHALWLAGRQEPEVFSSAHFLRRRTGSSFVVCVQTALLFTSLTCSRALWQKRHLRKYSDRR